MSSPRTPSRASSRASARPASRLSNKSSSQSPRADKKTRTKESIIASIEKEYPDVLDPDATILESDEYKDMNKRLGAKARPLEEKTRAEKLRILKQIAIGNCDYDKSDAIQQYIDMTTHDNTDEAIDQASAWIQQVLESALQKYEENIVIVTDDATDKKIRIRSGCEECASELRKKHISELTDIDTERQIELLRESKRTPSWYVLMKEQSQRLARGNDREGAKATMAKADDMRRQKMEEKEAAINAKYATTRDRTLDKQAKEIENLQERLALDLHAADEVYQNGLEQERKKLVVCIQSTITIAIRSCLEYLEKVEARGRVTKALNSFTKKFLKERSYDNLI